LNLSWRRLHYNPLLAAVLAVDVKGADLKWKESESLIKAEGFFAADHVHRLSNSTALHRVHNEHVLKLMVEMTPVYLVFRYNVCPDLFNRADPERIEELKSSYEDDAWAGVASS
jgi:hypothetical protein